MTTILRAMIHLRFLPILISVDHMEKLRGLDLFRKLESHVSAVGRNLLRSSFLYAAPKSAT